MNAQKLMKYMDAQGVPYETPGGRLRVMDASQLPGAHRQYFDKRGFYMSDKVDAAEEAVKNAEQAQAEADQEAKAARTANEDATLEAAKAKADVIDEITPLAGTEREMTIAGLLNPEGAGPVPAHLESHEPQAAAVEPVGDDSEQAAEDEANSDESKTLRGKLPPDFPHAKELSDAGYGTYAKVRALIATGDKWYNDVPGIGDKKAPDVEAALKE